MSIKITTTFVIVVEIIYGEDYRNKSCLNQKFLPPIVEIVKRFHGINVIHKNTAIGTTIESNTKALESFLTSCIPDLQN